MDKIQKYHKIILIAYTMLGAIALAQRTDSKQLEEAKTYIAEIMPGQRERVIWNNPILARDSLDEIHLSASKLPEDQEILHSAMNITEQQYYAYGNSHLANSQFLVVHAIAHSHLDVGWHKTLSQYFSGTHLTAHNSWYYANVQEIFYSVYDQLYDNKHLTFTVAELTFFEMWWNELYEEEKDVVRKFVQNGQLIFVGGGWVQPDEALSYYEDLIEVYTLAHNFLRDELQVFVEDTIQHLQRLKDRAMQFEWQTQGSQEESIFTHIFYNKYSSPPGFDFDVRNSIKAQFPVLNKNNLDTVAETLVYRMKNMSYFYQKDCMQEVCHYAQLFGDDFSYSRAELNYGNLTHIFEYINSNQERFRLNITFSSPLNYLKGIAAYSDPKTKSVEQKQSAFSADFLPYRDTFDAFWTGFYATRPNLKSVIRSSGRFLRSSRNYLIRELLQSIKEEFNSKKAVKLLQTLHNYSKQLAIAHHHDAITGTCHDEVAADYVARLDAAKQNVVQLLNSHGAIYCNQSNCLQNKIAEEQDQFYIEIQETTYDAETNKRWLQFDVTRDILAYSIVNYNTPVNAQLACFSSTGAACKLYLQIETVGQQISVIKFSKVLQEKSNILEMQADADSQSQNLCVQDNSTVCIQLESLIKVRLRAYLPSTSAAEQSEGPYIFKPLKMATPYYYQIVNKNSLLGVGVKLLIVEFQNIQAILFFDQQQNSIEIKTLIKPSAYAQAGASGGDIIVELENSGLDNGNVFYTDSNGYFVEQRQTKTINTPNRLTYKSDIYTSSNFYPIASFVYIEDKSDHSQRLVAFANDRAVGAASLHQGQIQLLVARSIDANDERGMFQKILENQTVQSSVSVYINIDDVAVRRQQYLRESQYILWISQNSSSQENNSMRSKREFPQLIKCDLQILRINTNSIDFLLQVTNMHPLKEQTFDIDPIKFGFSSNHTIRRTNLNGLQDTDNQPNNGTIYLKALQIQSFRITQFLNQNHESEMIAAIDKQNIKIQTINEKSQIIQLLTSFKDKHSIIATILQQFQFFPLFISNLIPLRLLCLSSSTNVPVQIKTLLMVFNMAQFGQQFSSTSESCDITITQQLLPPIFGYLLPLLLGKYIKCLNKFKNRLFFLYGMLLNSAIMPNTLFILQSVYLLLGLHKSYSLENTIIRCVLSIILCKAYYTHFKQTWQFLSQRNAPEIHDQVLYTNYILIKDLKVRIDTRFFCLINVFQKILLVVIMSILNEISRLLFAVILLCCYTIYLCKKWSYQQVIQNILRLFQEIFTILLYLQIYFGMIAANPKKRKKFNQEENFFEGEIICLILLCELSLNCLQFWNRSIDLRALKEWNSEKQQYQFQAVAGNEATDIEGLKK